MDDIHKEWRKSKFAELEKEKDWGYFATDQAQKDFAKYYHEQQVKKDLIADVVKPKGTVCKHKGCEHRHTNDLDGFCLKHYTQKSN